MLVKNAWIPMTLLCVSFLLRLSGSEGVSLFQFQRDAILDGEFWRVLSGHLVHGTWMHWLLNAAGLSLIWFIFPHHFRHISAVFLCIGIALLTSMTLLTLNPAVSWYLGMSALLHGLIVAWAVIDLLNGQRIALILLLLVSMKLVYEQWFGPLPGSLETTGLPVLVDAHLYGAVSGGILGIILVAFRSYKEKTGM